jgi:hypothetical protein
MGIFHPIERKKELVAGWVGRRVQEIFQREHFALAQKGDDPLVLIGLDVASKLVAGLGGDTDLAFTAEVEQGVKTGIAASFALAGDGDVVNGANAGAEGLPNRVKAVKNVHRR